jgi:hypothetical protein
MLQGWLSPLVTITRMCRWMPVSAMIGPSGSGGDGQLIAGIQQNPQQGSTEFLLLPMAVNRKPVTLLQGATGLSRFAFPRISPNGKWIAVIQNNGILLYDGMTGDPTNRIEVKGSQPDQVVFARDGDLLVAFAAAFADGRQDVVLKGEDRYRRR